MKSRKTLWIGIFIGFLSAVVIIGAVFAAWKIIGNSKEAVSDQVVPPVPQAATPAATPSAGTELTEVLEDSPVWEGTWNRIGDVKFDGSFITITEAGYGTINFDISAYSGGNMGAIAGSAEVLGDVAEYDNPEGGYGISFTKAEDTLTVTMKGEFFGVLGNGVTIDGIYGRDAQDRPAPDLLYLGAFDNSGQEEAFRDLVKEDYDLFTDCFHLYTKRADLDGFNANVTSFGVRGLFSTMEGIIMAGPGNTLHAAVIDNDVVKYYTNSVVKDTLPVTIDRWRQNFKELEVLQTYTGDSARVLTLEDVEKTGFQVLQEHTFRITFDQLGTVDFVAGTILTEDGKLEAEYYVVNEYGEIIYKIPACSAGDYVSTRAVSFQNLSSGNPELLTDIIIIEEITDSSSEFLDIPIPYCRIFTQEGADFSVRIGLYEDVNTSGMNENIQMVTEYITKEAFRKGWQSVEDLSIYRDYSIKTSFENWGPVELVAAGQPVEGQKQLRLYLVDTTLGEIIYEFTVIKQGSLNSIKEVSITDVNHDGLKDIILIVEYADTESYPECYIYIQNGKEFTNLFHITEELNLSGRNQNVALVKDYLKDKDTDLFIDDLKAQGMTIFTDKIYPVETEFWGNVQLVPGYRRGIAMNVLCLYFTDTSGKILYQLPGLEQRDCYNIEEFADWDVDKDGRKDIIMIADYTTGFGTDGVTPEPYCNVFLQTDIDYVNMPEIDKLINYRLPVVNMDELMKLTESISE